MEDDDDYEPDQSGALDLRYRGMVVAEPRIWTFAHCLLTLDVSFNQLQSLDGIASLQLLQELNCACNKLSSLPETIASMAWLRVIKANGNNISAVPKQLGKLKTLEVLNLSENALTALPQEIAGCSSLQTLLLQNNNLPRLPLSLATLSGQIQQLDISNNSPELQTTLPSEIHRDVNSIMWILALQQEKRHRIDRLKQDVKTLQHDNIAMEKELTKAREQIVKLESTKQALVDDMEDVKYFLVARSHCRELRRRGLELWQEVKRACAQRQRI